ncbi:MAG TPA: DUF6701 domain-containing protein, partial [Burkholderiales bacterium]|nr:DUF6701 domain-containing protein [Burkholderiales bacterium]
PTFATACTSGAFTYVGQSFGYANTASQPTITVTAQNLANSTTTLYTGNWWRITGASLTGKAYAALTGTLDTSGISGADPAIAETAGLPGTGTLTFNSGTGFFFTRAAPAVPFNAEIGLTINVTDADGIAYASNPVAFGAPTAGNGIAFSTGRQMRFGRLRLQNANGSQLIAMPIPMSAQYWNGSGFVTNTVDNCTAILIANIGLGSYLPNLGAGDTTATIGGVFNAGVGTLTLSAPGSAKHGSVDVTVNLTGAGKTYLQGAWAGATYTDNPTARATFGIYRNTNKFIFRQENY